MTEIIKDIFIGPFPTSDIISKFDTIVSISLNDIGRYFGNHLIVKIPNSREVNIFPYLEDFIHFMEENRDGEIYIHCDTGRDRSIVFMIAYIIWKYKLTFDIASKIVKKKIKLIDINSTFECSLRIFERWDGKCDLVYFAKIELEKWKNFSSSINI